MSTKSPTRRIASFNASVALHGELVTLARREGMTLSGFLRRLAADHLAASGHATPVISDREARPCI